MKSYKLLKIYNWLTDLIVIQPKSNNKSEIVKVIANNTDYDQTAFFDVNNKDYDYTDNIFHVTTQL